MTAVCGRLLLYRSTLCGQPVPLITEQQQKVWKDTFHPTAMVRHCLEGSAWTETGVLEGSKAAASRQEVRPHLQALLTVWF